MSMTFKTILEYRLMPRLMMFVMTIMYIRVLEWGMTLEELSTQQSASMTGAFAVWLGSEK